MPELSENNYFFREEFKIIEPKILKSENIARFSIPLHDLTKATVHARDSKNRNLVS